VHAQEALKNPRYEDFLFVQMPETRRNIMTWLGNGLTVAQEKDEKTTGYLDTVNIPPAINKGLRPRPQKETIATGAINGFPHPSSEPKVPAAHIEELATAVATVPL
jgi:hypothetical protein